MLPPLLHTSVRQEAGRAHAVTSTPTYPVRLLTLYANTTDPPVLAVRSATTRVNAYDLDYDLDYDLGAPCCTRAAGSTAQ